jgi:hypothetical protein
MDLHIDQVVEVRPGLIDHEPAGIVAIPVQNCVDESRLVPHAVEDGVQQA